MRIVFKYVTMCDLIYQAHYVLPHAKTISLLTFDYQAASLDSKIAFCFSSALAKCPAYCIINIVGMDRNS